MNTTPADSTPADSTHVFAKNDIALYRKPPMGNSVRVKIVAVEVPEHNCENSYTIRMPDDSERSSLASYLSIPPPVGK